MLKTILNILQQKQLFECQKSRDSKFNIRLEVNIRPQTINRLRSTTI
jgi:hypothetical protein